MKRSLISILLGFLVVGCVSNSYSKFYVEGVDWYDPKYDGHIIPPNGDPVIIQSTSDKFNDDMDKMAEDGYNMMGYSLFNSRKINKENLMRFAKKIKAAVVLEYSEYKGTISGAFPITYPTKVTTSSVFGTSTVHGSHTVEIPYSVRRYDYMATFWVKGTDPPFGVIPGKISSEMHRKIGTNKGVEALVVVKNSPAYYADIFKGDIILKVGDNDVYGMESYVDAVIPYKGKTTTVVVLRDGKRIKKKVHIKKH